MIKKFKSKFLNALFDVLELVLIAAILFGIINLFVIQLLSITGDSMLPNFENNEQILAEKASIHFRDLKRGDIVIFKHPTTPQKLVIKRVVGLPKEKFLIAAGRIYINGKELSETYVKEQNSTFESNYIKEDTEVYIPEDSYILLGDNRQDSADSRGWGPIKKSGVIGKALIVYYPFDKARLITN